VLAGGTRSPLNPFMRAANKPLVSNFCYTSKRQPWPIHTLVNVGIENILVPSGSIGVILGDNSIENSIHRAARNSIKQGEGDREANFAATRETRR